MREATSVTFSIEAEAGDDLIGSGDIRTLFNRCQALLREVEHIVTGEEPQADWRWAEDYHIPLTATVNGLNHSTLVSIAATAQEAFERAQFGGREIEWPRNFTDRAQRSVRDILRVLNRIDAITVSTEGREARIESAEVTERVGRVRAQRVFSTVEGYLRTLSDRRTYIYGRLVEHGTGRSVSCRFSIDMDEQVSTLFRKRVIVSGSVAYDDDGNPLSIIGVESIDERREGEPLRAFLGAAPQIAEGSTLGAVIRVMRTDD